MHRKDDGGTVGEIGRRLREAFAPLRLEIDDHSERHRGHPGATSGGGHYRVTIVSEAFRGLSRIEQHRAVHRALDGMLDGRIHALSLSTSAPD